MAGERSSDITLLLREWGRGDQEALERLIPLVYDQLRRIAQVHMKNESPGNTLQATALVNEAYLRLVDAAGIDWHDRAHFFAIAARIMRRILVDRARARAASRRGGQAHRTSAPTAFNLEQVPDFGADRGAELIALDDQLKALSQWDSRKAQVIELRFFGGLSVEETADVLKVSIQTVKRDWKLARAWLTRELNQ
jgi:RNA polymerase sigma-70 factor, ECF subfamily